MSGRFNAGVDSVEMLVRQISSDLSPLRDGLLALGGLAALRLSYLAVKHTWGLCQAVKPALMAETKPPLKERCGEWAVLINAGRGLGFALASELAQSGFNLVLVDFKKHTLELFKEYILRECDNKVEVVAVTCGLTLHSENLAAQEISDTIRKMNIRLLFNICGFPHGEGANDADNVTVSPKIDSFLTFHSKIALTSQLIFEMLVQSQRNDHGATVLNIGAYFPNVESQDWTEFNAIQSYGAGLRLLADRNGNRNRLNIMGVQYINYFTHSASSPYISYFLPTAKAYAGSLLSRLERGQEDAWVVSWRHSIIMGLLSICPYFSGPY